MGNSLQTFSRRLSLLGYSPPFRSSGPSGAGADPQRHALPLRDHRDDREAGLGARLEAAQQARERAVPETVALVARRRDHALGEVVPHHRHEPVRIDRGRGQEVVDGLGLGARHGAEDVGELRLELRLGVAVARLDDLVDGRTDAEQSLRDLALGEREGGPLVGGAEAREHADGVGQGVDAKGRPRNVRVLRVAEVGLDAQDGPAHVAPGLLRHGLEEVGGGLAGGRLGRHPERPAQGLQEDVLGVAVAGEPDDGRAEDLLVHPVEGGREGGELHGDGRLLLHDGFFSHGALWPRLCFLHTVATPHFCPTSSFQRDFNLLSFGVIPDLY